jgi:predicted nucleic acid-binding protein
MYLLDTHVLVELRKAHAGEANAGVAAWARRVAPASLFLSALTVSEMELGIRMVERRNSAQGALLRAWMDQRVLPAFAERILAVDTAVARRCAELYVDDSCSGVRPSPRPLPRDAFLAATALVHGMTLVTRNVADFESTGVATLNPWIG